MQRIRKGNETTPFIAESFETNLIGPAKKNLDMPKEEEKMLNRKVISGKAELRSS